jgi:flagellar basal-body rod protein FlgF
MDSQNIAVLSLQKQLKFRMDVVANNIANISTNGFKRHFSDVEAENAGAAIGSVPQNPALAATPLDLRQGSFDYTGNPLDLAIEGPGFFQVETGGGVRLTRNGRFTLDAEGQLVTSSGASVLDIGGAPVQVPLDAGNIVVAKDGTVSAGGQVVARLGVVNAVVASEGGGLYLPVTAPEQDTAFGVRQGALEASNVSAVSELAEMIEIQRAYERAASLTNSEHERMRHVIQIMGRSA